MKIIKTLAVSLLGASSFVAMMAITAAPASAQATRTWVSGVGDDVNPCSRTAPCKTFAGAISKTAAGGEINCLDPGGFGAVTITKSMTISCPYTEGGALAGGNGITVNLPSASDVVFIRGLDIFGVNPPTHGIRFIAQGTLHVQDSVIRRFNATNSSGISFQPSGVGKLYVSNTTIADNGNGATGGGILIQPTGAGGTAQVVIDNVRIENNANVGLFVNTTGATNANGIGVQVHDSSMSGNATGVSVLTPAGTQVAVVTITDSSVVNNSSTGLLGNGSNAFLRVGNTTITGNTQGVTAAGAATIQTYGNNRLVSNPTVGGFANGAFTGAAPPTL